MFDEAAAMTELNKTADDNTADSLLDKYKTAEALMWMTSWRR